MATGISASQLTMRKRARSKHVGLVLATRLTEYAKGHLGEPEGSLEQSYRNSIYCAGVQIQEAGLIRSRYCSNRWCPVCNRIRMGKAISTYMPHVDCWERPCFVTLTVQNCSAAELPWLVDRMLAAFTASTGKVKRTMGKVTAIRKMECTYGKGYHPHFHVIVDGPEAAYALRDAWMVFGPKYTRRRVSAEAQHVQEADKRSLVELFKYATKLVAKGPDGVKRFISVKRLDVIFRALRNRRTYQTYGFKASTDTESVTDCEATVTAFKEVHSRVIWLWDQGMADWVNHATGECLTGNEPPPRTGAVDAVAVAEAAAGPL